MAFHGFTPLVRFGVFELDVRAGELRKAGRKIRLQDQPFQILTMLLARPGEVVTREEIRERLWSDDTTVEFDHGINAAIKRLRDALGDSAESPRFVETLPRRGYRFIGRVEPADVAAPSVPSSLPAVPAAARPQSRVSAKTWASVGAVGLLGVAAAVWIVLAAATTRAPGVVPTTVPLTGNSGIETLPSFSPDGQQVAYAWDGATGGSLDVYVKLIGAGTPLRLTTDDADEFSPTWSPDGRQIAFLRRTSLGAGIFVIPALGGPERKLGDSSARLFAAGAYYGKLAWSPDGRFLALVDRSSPSDGESIFLMTIATGEKRRVTSPSEEWPFGDWSPAFSPDGRMIAFDRVAGILVSEIYVQRVSSDGAPAGEPVRLTFDRRAVYSLDWTPDGRDIVFSSNRGGSFTLWRIAASGGAPEPFATSGSDAYWLSVARQGHRAAYVRQFNDQNIWRTDGPLATKGTPGESDANRTRLIFSQGGNTAPQFSPDGGRVAFGSRRSGYQEIWVSDSDGSNPLQLTFFAGPSVGSPRWSPDGNRIAFDSSKEAQRSVYVIDRDGKSLRRVTTDHFANGRPSWSTDGAWIYFGSDRRGTWQVWKAPAEGGQAVQVTSNGGREAFESRDGKYVYYAKAEGVPGIWRIAVEGGEETQVLDQGTMNHWALMERGLCFLDPDTKPPAIQFFEFATRRLATVAFLPRDGVPPGGWGTPAIAVSPDAMTILYVQAARTESHIQLVENLR